MLNLRYAPIECIQHPGETIFVPGGMWHVVLNIDTTVFCFNHRQTFSILPPPLVRLQWPRTLPARPISLLFGTKLSEGDQSYQSKIQYGAGAMKIHFGWAYYDGNGNILVTNGWLYWNDRKWYRILRKNEPGLADVADKVEFQLLRHKLIKMSLFQIFQCICKLFQVDVNAKSGVASDSSSDSSSSSSSRFGSKHLKKKMVEIPQR